MIKDIKTLKDVTTFAKELVKEGVSFHPDDDFNDYVNLDNKTPTYSKKEADFRNKLMDKCFKICKKEGVSIYDIMMEILLKDTGLAKVIPLPSTGKVITK